MEHCVTDGSSLNEVMPMKGHVTFARHYLIVMMPCLVSCNITWAQCAGVKQRYIIALGYVTEDERMNGWAWMSIWEMKRKKEKGREKKRRGGCVKRPVIGREGWGRGWGIAWSANERKAKPPLVWQLRACTLLFSWLPTSTPSPQFEFCLFKWKGETSHRGKDILLVMSKQLQSEMFGLDACVQRWQTPQKNRPPYPDLDIVQRLHVNILVVLAQWARNWNYTAKNYKY